MDFESLQTQIRNFCEERDWDQFHGPKDLAIGLVTEASELLELFRFLDQSESERLVKDASGRIKLGEELADVMFFLLRFADRFDFDLLEVSEKKLAKNAQKYPVEKSRGSNKKYTEI